MGSVAGIPFSATKAPFRVSALALLVVLSTTSGAAAQAVAAAVSTTAGYSTGGQSDTGPECHSLPLDFVTLTLGGDACAEFGALSSATSVDNHNSANVDTGGNMAGWATWRDTFSITGSTSGQTVDFVVRISARPTLNVPADAPTANPSRESVLRSSAGVWLWGFPGGGPCNGITTVVSGTIPPCNAFGFEQVQRRFYLGNETGFSDDVQGTFDSELVVSLIVGQTYSVQQLVGTRNDIFSASPAVSSSGITATFSISAAGEGYGYTTASGRRYDAPVTNTAPTAVAGSNQTVRPGETVHLDGGGSFDDNTPTDQLQYSWTFVTLPSGSQATLTNANTMTPSFVPDLSGAYVIGLVVTDQGGMSSAPSQLTVSENPPPTADAGPDQLVIVGQVVSLNGAGADSDGGALSYAWTLTGAPVGSAAHLVNASLPNATFIPDRPGVYTAQLSVSDVLGAGAPDSLQISATTATAYAETLIQAASAIAVGLPEQAVSTRGNRNALIQFFRIAVAALQGGSTSEARHQIQQAISRTDGCVLRGTPDENGPSRDWVTSCDAQNGLHALLADALAVTAP